VTGPDPAGTDPAGTDPAGTDPADTDGWERLSPRMLLVHPVQELVRALPALLGVLIAGTVNGNGEWWSLAAAGALVLLGVARWFTTTYRVTDDLVQVRRGVFSRRLLTVPRDRVRTVDITAHVLHRVLGLARVSVGTGLTDQKKDQLRLDALDARQAELLRVRLLDRSPVAATGAAPTGQETAGPGGGTAGTASGAEVGAGRGGEVELARLRGAWVRFGPFSLSGLVTIGIVVGLVSRVTSNAHIRLDRVGAVREGVSVVERASLWLVAVLVVLAVVVLVAVLSTAGYLLAFWNFRLVRQPGGTLHVTRGLITTRATTLEERRLRGVEYNEPLLLRMVRGARCIAIATGLRVGRGAERGGSLLLPPAPRAVAAEVAADVLGTAAPVGAELTGHGAAARRRRFSRALLGVAPVVLVLVLLWALAGWPAWLWQLSLVLVVLAVAVAADRSRALGHAVVDGVLVARLGSLVRRRSMIRQDGIIGWNLRRSFFQRRSGLVTLTATTAAGTQRYRVLDVAAAEAVRVVDGCSPGLLDPFRAGTEPVVESATTPGGRGVAGSIV
jgi:putative membrane protein